MISSRRGLLQIVTRAAIGTLNAMAIGESMTRYHPRRDLSERVDGVVRDVAAFRVVAVSDLIKHQFDGHTFAGRRGIGEAEQRVRSHTSPSVWDCQVQWERGRLGR